MGRLKWDGMGMGLDMDACRYAQVTCKSRLLLYVLAAGEALGVDKYTAAGRSVGASA